MYANPIIVLFVITCIGGAFLYPQYRLDVRPTLEDLQYRAANGVFEIKEHLAAIGLGLLPAYALFWRTPLVADQAGKDARGHASLARNYLSAEPGFAIPA